jgi:hypothetical protein
MASEPDLTDMLKKGVMVSSEFFLPGGSNLVKGDYKQAGLHAVVGMAAQTMFGLPGLLLVSANSFTKAVTGRHLNEYLGFTSEPRQPRPSPAAKPKQTRSRKKKVDSNVG